MDSPIEHPIFCPCPKCKSRIEDPELIKFMQENLSCIICDAPYPDIHHWKSRGSGGDDIPENLVPLCREHHSEIHAIGRDTFRKKYERVENWRAMAKALEEDLK